MYLFISMLSQFLYIYCWWFLCIAVHPIVEEVSVVGGMVQQTRNILLPFVTVPSIRPSVNQYKLLYKYSGFLLKNSSHQIRQYKCVMCLKHTPFKYRSLVLYMYYVISINSVFNTFINKPWKNQHIVGAFLCVPYTTIRRGKYKTNMVQQSLLSETC